MRYCNYYNNRKKYVDGGRTKVVRPPIIVPICDKNAFCLLKNNEQKLEEKILKKIKKTS